MGIIAWIILGLGAGLLANMAIPGKRSQGLILTCLIGIAGVLACGWAATELFHVHTLNGFFNLSTWVTAIAGSAVLLLVVHLFTGRSSRSGRFAHRSNTTPTRGACDSLRGLPLGWSPRQCPAQREAATHGAYPADALDGVAHDIAGTLRRWEVGVRGHVDLRQAVEQIPGIVARLNGRPCVQHGVRVQEDAGLPRRLERQNDPRVPLDVAQLRLYDCMWPLTRLSPSSPTQMTLTCGLPSALVVLR